MRYHDHTGGALFRAVAASVDAEILAVRARHVDALAAEKARRVTEAQQREDQRVVANREANVTVRRIAERVR